jgi:hypothetical protein
MGDAYDSPPESIELARSDEASVARGSPHAWLPSPGEICKHLRDKTGGSETGVPTKGLRALFAEWDADYAARRAEDAHPRLRSPESATVTRGGPDEGRGR